MTNTKTTRNAFLASVLSLVLCASMLVGSTFAWFTDTATTGVNTITSGNLDIALQYSKDMSDNSWQNAEKEAEIFGDGTLWEPGHTEVLYFKVINNGNLALKYHIGTNLIENIVGKTKSNTEIDLRNYIKFDVIKVTSAYANRADARAAVTTPAAFGDYSEEFKLVNRNDFDTFAVVAYMPETTGNEANHNGVDVPSVKFGISVIATQLTSESDSYGPDYDVNAKAPETIEKEFDKDGATVITGINISANIPAEAGLTADNIDVEDATKLILVYEPTALNDNITVDVDENAETYEVSLKTADGKKVIATKPITVTMKIGVGHKGAVQLYHNEAPIDSIYNSVTGELTFTTTNFSPFTVVYEKPMINITYKTETDVIVGKLSYDPDADNSRVFSELKIYENFIAVDEFKDFTNKVASGGNGSQQLVGMPYYYFGDDEATKVSYGNETFFYTDKEFTAPATMPTEAGNYTVYCKFANHYLNWFCFSNPLMAYPGDLGSTYEFTVKGSSLGTYMSMGMGSQAVGTPSDGWTVVAEMKDGNGQWVSVPAEAINNYYWEPKIDLTKLGAKGDTVHLRIVDLYCAVKAEDGTTMYYSHVEKIPVNTEFILTIG